MNTLKSAERECWECNATYGLVTREDVSEEELYEWLMEDLLAKGWVEDDTLADRYGICGDCVEVTV